MGENQCVGSGQVVQSRLSEGERSACCPECAFEAAVSFSARGRGVIPHHARVEVLETSHVTDEQALAYRWEVIVFKLWCREHALADLPALPMTLALYVDHLHKERAPSEVALAVAAIGWAHAEARVDSPERHPDVLLAMRRVFDAPSAAVT